MMAMKVAFFRVGATDATYPLPGPIRAERNTPQIKNIPKIAGTLPVKVNKATAPAEKIVPVMRGNFNPILSATHPQELSPNTIPTIDTEIIRPRISGETFIDERYSGRIGPSMLIARTPNPITAITATSSKGGALPNIRGRMDFIIH
jgi:hypothetical protein